MKRIRSFSWTAPALSELRGKKAAIIGGTSGIGRAVARLLAANGAAATVVGRTFQDSGTPRIDFVEADLSRMAEARRVAETLPAETLDFIVFTTGIMAGPKRETTSDGIERDLAVSYLSRFVILRGIADRLGTQRPNDAVRPRMFVMGFPGSGQRANVDDLNSDRSYGGMTAHMNTVAGNEALVLDAAHRYPDIDSFGLNPGFVKTGIRANLFGGDNWLYRTMERMAGFMTKDAYAYADKIVPLFLAPELLGRSGMMFDDKARAIEPSAWLDADATTRLIAASEGILLSFGNGTALAETKGA